MSEGHGEGTVAQVGEDIHSTAVARSSQDLKTRKTWLTHPSRRPLEIPHPFQDPPCTLGLLAAG